MGERYVAGRDQMVDGALRQVGEPVPEAAGWTNLRAYLSAGWIVVLEDDPEPEPSADGQAGFEPEPSALDTPSLSSFPVAPEPGRRPRFRCPAPAPPPDSADTSAASTADLGERRRPRRNGG